MPVAKYWYPQIYTFFLFELDSYVSLDCVWSPTSLTVTILCSFSEPSLYFYIKEFLASLLHHVLSYAPISVLPQGELVIFGSENVNFSPGP